MYQKVVETRGDGMPYVQQIKRDGLPSEVASLIYFSLSDESKYFTGTVQSFDEGWMW
jgi:NAD(P)-dependent dehydrogenase (short-subunit alcohol dehydrogenase family)